MNSSKIPSELSRIIKLFHNNRLNYILFKCEHIFEGENKNLDILFERKEDYDKASRILVREGYVLYLSENIEKYKRMYVKFNEELSAIHLHREVAWHGIKALDKDKIFERAEKLDKYIVVPSKEDYLLIHVAHVLFENFKIASMRELMMDYFSQTSDWKYIDDQLIKNKWKGGFYYLLNCIKKRKEPGFLILFKIIIIKCITDPLIIPYVSLKVIKRILRKISLKRKGCIISLIGVNGAGKTTLTRHILNEMNPLCRFINVGCEGYYFGWQPSLFLTKIISKIFKKRNKRIFKEVAKENRKSHFFQELLLIYNYFEFLYRYIFYIFPKLRKGNFIVSDRYFYDMYGQYSHAPKSKILRFLFRVYPRPDLIFVLDVDIDTILNRGKAVKDYASKKEITRTGIETDYFFEQKKRYIFLQKKMHARLIDTGDDMKKNIRQIINLAWKKMVNKSRN